MIIFATYPTMDTNLITLHDSLPQGIRCLLLDAAQRLGRSEFVCSEHFLDIFITQYDLHVGASSALAKQRAEACTGTKRDRWFTFANDTIAAWHRRAQDPNDPTVSASFTAKCWADLDPDQIFNVDEEGKDENKGRNEVVSGRGEARDGLNRRFEITSGDQAPFHVTNVLTTSACGSFFNAWLIHSSPGSENPRVTRRETDGLLEDDGSNPIGIDVDVSTNGSMTRKLFVRWAHHLVKQLEKRGFGKGARTAVLVFDGHTSRWTYEGIAYLIANNILPICIPSHTSIVAQPNDGGTNAASKTHFGTSGRKWRQGAGRLRVMERADFNRIFVRGWKALLAEQRALLQATGSNASTRAWEGCGLYPYNPHCAKWEAAVKKQLGGAGGATAQTVGADVAGGGEAGDGGEEAMDGHRRRSEARLRAADVGASFRARRRHVEAAVDEAADEAVDEAVDEAGINERAAAEAAVNMAAMDEAMANEEAVETATTAEAAAAANGSAAGVVGAVVPPLKTSPGTNPEPPEGGVPPDTPERGHRTMPDKTTEEPLSATVVRQANSILVCPDDGYTQTIPLADMRRFFETYALAPPSAAEIEAIAGEAAKKAKAKQRKAEKRDEREAERRTVDAARKEHSERLEALRMKHGLSQEAFDEIRRAIADAPPTEIDGIVVYSSAQINQHHLIRRACLDAMAAPLHEATAAAKELAATKKRKKQSASVPDSSGGVDLLTKLDFLQAAEETAEANQVQRVENAAAKRQKKALKAAKEVNQLGVLLLKAAKKEGGFAKMTLQEQASMIRARGGKAAAQPKGDADGRAKLLAAWQTVSPKADELERLLEEARAAQNGDHDDSENGEDEDDSEDEATAPADGDEEDGDDE